MDKKPPENNFPNKTNPPMSAQRRPTRTPSSATNNVNPNNNANTSPKQSSSVPVSNSQNIPQNDPTTQTLNTQQRQAQGNQLSHEQKSKPVTNNTTPQNQSQPQTPNPIHMSISEREERMRDIGVRNQYNHQANNATAKTQVNVKVNVNGQNVNGSNNSATNGSSGQGINPQAQSRSNPSLVRPTNTVPQNSGSNSGSANNNTRPVGAPQQTRQTQNPSNISGANQRPTPTQRPTTSVSEQNFKNAISSSRPVNNQGQSLNGTVKPLRSVKNDALDDSQTRQLPLTPITNKQVPPQNGSQNKKPTPSNNIASLDIDDEYDIKQSKKERRRSEGVNTLFSVLKAIGYISFIIGIAIFLSYYIISFGNDVFAFVKEDFITDITIEENVTVEEIANILFENEIIAHPKMFVLYSAYNKDDGKFVAGTYQITPTMNYDELLKIFKATKKREIVHITIPEGYTVMEIIDVFLEKGMGTEEGFIDAINNYPYDYPFVKALEGNLSEDRTYRLEGYLFPDTYQFYSDSSEVNIIAKFLANFNRKFAEIFYTRAEELGMTVDEVIRLASIIEKETRYLDEFDTVSSVFHNRLNNPNSFPYLESDATIMYAIHYDTGERLAKLEGKDTSYVSPYNSYTNKGLPPGPISNPGYNAIACALYPADTKYYFFVADSTGKSTFSRTLEEHNKAIIEARKN